MQSSKPDPLPETHQREDADQRQTQRGLEVRIGFVVVGPNLDALLVVLDGSGWLTTELAVVGLHTGAVVWLPRRQPTGATPWRASPRCRRDDPPGTMTVRGRLGRGRPRVRARRPRGPNPQTGPPSGSIANAGV